MDELDTASQNFLNLREAVKTVQIASRDQENRPHASYAPFVWYEGCVFLYLSELARHTQNLRNCSSVGLMLIEDESESRNPFARKRIYFNGEAETVSRRQPLYVQVLSGFNSRFGSVMEVIEPLPDFHLFRILLTEGQYTQGFGQAFNLTGEHLDILEHIDPRKG